MSIDTFLEVPFSLISPADASELAYMVAELGDWEIVEGKYLSGLYDLNSERISYIDLVEYLEERRKESRRYLFIVRVSSEEILSQSGLIETFQRICALRRDGNSASNLRLALVVH